MHWTDKYLNRRYVPETGDCVALAQLVAKEYLRLHVSLPSEHAVGLRDQAAQIVKHQADYAERVAEPVEGHPVQLLCRGNLRHVGVMAFLANEWWVLHADKTFGAVVRQPLRRLLLVDYKLEGYYKWKS